LGLAVGGGFRVFFGEGCLQGADDFFLLFDELFEGVFLLFETAADLALVDGYLGFFGFLIRVLEEGVSLLLQGVDVAFRFSEFVL
jgi:hypothetical protein